MKKVTMHKNFNQTPATPSQDWHSSTKSPAIWVTATLIALQLLACAPAPKPQVVAVTPENISNTCHEADTKEQPQAENANNSIAAAPPSPTAEPDAFKHPQTPAPEEASRNKPSCLAEPMQQPEPGELPAQIAASADTQAAPQHQTNSHTTNSTSAAEARPESIHTAITALEQKSYTVKPGENLYTISKLDNIYADGMLWPLIYRANRDQIKDPRQIYPGQELNIPRNITAVEQQNARKSALENPIFTTGQNQ